MKPAKVVPEKCIGFTTKPAYTAITSKESILYALGLFLLKLNEALY